jgi:hypothetical protein
MITKLPGWNATTDARGRVVLHLESRPFVGAIRYTEHVRPLLEFSEIVRRHCSQLPYRVTSIGAPDIFMTDEGHPAAVVRINCEIEGHATRRVLGCVIRDESYSETVGVTADQGEMPRFEAVVRALVRSDRDDV